MCTKELIFILHPLEEMNIKKHFETRQDYGICSNYSVFIKVRFEYNLKLLLFFFCMYITQFPISCIIAQLLKTLFAYETCSLLF